MTRHAIEVMGTVFSLDLRDEVPATVVGDVEADLRRVDRTFTTYDDMSPVSRLARGEITLRDCPPEVGEVLDRCAQATRATGGWFSPLAGGRLDPTGLVKGWAIARVDALLAAAGSARYAIGGGGDVLVRGRPEAGELWTVGLADPRERNAVLTTVHVADAAVATSGVVERGRHVLDPFTGRPSQGLLSVTVVGPDIVAADVYATAALAMGRAAVAWLDGLDGYAGLAVADDGTVSATSDWRWPAT